MEKRVIFISGKGGVGKTALTAAIGKAVSTHSRVLVVSIDQPETMAGFLKMDRIPNEPVEVTQKLSAVYLDRDVVLNQFIQNLVRIKSAADWISAHPLFPYISSVAPGIKEYLILNRIRLFAETNDDEFQTILVDTPATGHALDFFNITKLLRGMIRSGPFFTQAIKTDAFLKNSRMTRIVLVTLPLEIPIRETIDFQQRLQTRLNLSAFSVILNNYELSWDTQQDGDASCVKNKKSCKQFDSQELKKLIGADNFSCIHQLNEFTNYRHRISIKLEAYLKKEMKVPVLRVPRINSQHAPELVDKIKEYLLDHGRSILE